jgi:hypothetical protein
LNNSGDQLGEEKDEKHHEIEGAVRSAIIIVN